jgi:hypothetical protein
MRSKPILDTNRIIPGKIGTALSANAADIRVEVG